MTLNVLRRLVSRLRASSQIAPVVEEIAPSPTVTPPAVAPEEPVDLFRHYSALCEAAGVDRVYLNLTFDCDTDEDIAAARDLDVELRRRGIRAGYAVPGVQLERGASTWQRIAQDGAEFLNHGWQAHTEYRDDRYWPATFYNEMSEAAVLADIRRGHQTVIDVLGSAPEALGKSLSMQQIVTELMCEGKVYASLGAERSVVENAPSALVAGRLDQRAVEPGQIVARHE